MLVQIAGCGQLSIRRSTGSAKGQAQQVQLAEQIVAVEINENGE